MQQKSTRGVRQEEVFAAADALLADKLRPTIERVRLKLGRGSPNTVAPMLETWFAGLGVRLGVAPESEGEGGPPASVREAMGRVWSAALEAARQEARGALSGEREALAAEQQSLASQRDELARQQAAGAERIAALQESHLSARRQLETASEREAALQSRVTSLERDLSTSRETAGALLQELNERRRRFDEQAASHANDRKQIEGSAAATQRRLLAEVDRARQEAKHHLARVETAERVQHAEREAAARGFDELSKQHHQAQVQIAALQERLAASEQRQADLTGELQQQRGAMAAVLARLSAGSQERSGSRRRSNASVIPRKTNRSRKRAP